MKKIKLYPSGKEVECEDSQTVLGTLEKYGYVIPNNCRAGACGECKVKVRSGTFDQGFILDMALSQEDRNQGYGLMCMAKPTSDILEIEFATDDARPKLFAPRENMSFIVTEKYLATDSIAKIRLRPLGTPMRFFPGQYVTLGGSRPSIPERSYSIANIPNHDGEVVLYITKQKNGTTSKWIHEEVRAGDIVNVSGPYGTFIGDPRAETKVLCLAAGSGLAPIMSLAQAALLRGGFRYPAEVLFSARTKTDVFDLGFFKFLESKFRNFKFQYTLTQEKNPGGFEGRIPQVLKDHYKNLNEYSLYIAGSPDFVEDCKKMALSLGALPEHIHTEGFHSQNQNDFPTFDKLF